MKPIRQAETYNSPAKNIFLKMQKNAAESAFYIETSMTLVQRLFFAFVLIGGVIAVLALVRGKRQIPLPSERIDCHILGIQQNVYPNARWERTMLAPVRAVSLNVA